MKKFMENLLIATGVTCVLTGVSCVLTAAAIDSYKIVRNIKNKNKLIKNIKKEIEKGLEEGSIVEIDGEYYKVEKSDDEATE